MPTETFEYIGAVTLSSDTSAMAITGIPGTYTDLYILLDAQNNIGSGIGMRFNNNTSNTYYRSRFIFYGADNSTNRFIQRAGTYSYIDFGPEAFSLPTSGTYYPVSVVQVYDYANTASQKTMNAIYGDTNGENDITRGLLFNNTTTITSIQIVNNGGNLRAGSSMYIYGILKA